VKKVGKVSCELIGLLVKFIIVSIPLFKTMVYFLVGIIFKV
jgi:hypothetical protein